MEARLLAFIGVAMVLTVTPGPDFALVTRIGLARGRTAAWFSALGVVSGHLTWGIAAGTGIATLFHASPTLYTIMRVVGGGYLIWLGSQAVFMHRESLESFPSLLSPVNRHTLLNVYRQGLLNDLLNPKIGVFYSTLLPQFIVPGQSVFLSSLLLAGLFALIVALWLGFYVMILARTEAVFRRPRVRRTLDRATGLVLVGLGIRVITEQR